MKISIAIIVASLLCAIIFTMVAEKRPSDVRVPWVALLALYGVCAGIVSAIIVYFFAPGELASVALGILLGLPVFLVMVKISEMS